MPFLEEMEKKKLGVLYAMGRSRVISVKATGV